MKASILVLIWIFVWDAHGSVRKHNQSHREIPISSSRSLRQQVDSYVELLEKEINEAKSNKDRFHSLNHILQEIRSLRDNGAPQGAVDEAYMDLLVSVLESLPTEKKFKKTECSKYENDLISQFEPQAEEAPEEPAVKPGWSVLHSLCQ